MIDNMHPIDPNHCDSDKGEPNCRCNCCIYWRRHVHRVAANRDRAAGIARTNASWAKGKLDFYIKQANFWREKYRKLDREKKERENKSLFQRIFNR